jgi:hypothetical protein
MAPIPNNPLTFEHLQQIRNALSTAAVAQQHIDLAKRAGIDVSAQEQLLKDQMAKLLAIKNVYFPGQ